MSIMNYHEWMDKTKFPNRRSAQLTRIDETLRIHVERPGEKTKKDLFDALLVWIKLKGRGWKTTKRNSQKAVERLVEQVTSGNWQWQNQINEHTDHTPKVRPIPPLGSLVSGKGVDGRIYNYFKQSDKFTCGPACVAIIFEFLFSVKISPLLLKNTFENAEGISAPRGPGTVYEPSGSHDWNNVGYAIAMLPDALRQTARQVGRPITVIIKENDHLQPVFLDRLPIITVVNWGNPVANHFVVVANKNKTISKLIILDPYYGVQSTTYNGKTIDPYQPEVGARGTWYPWVCQVYRS